MFWCLLWARHCQGNGKLGKQILPVNKGVKMNLHIMNVRQNYANTNRPFRSYFVPLHQNESLCKTIYMKMCLACMFIFMQMKLIFM